MLTTTRIVYGACVDTISLVQAAIAYTAFAPLFDILRILSKRNEATRGDLRELPNEIWDKIEEDGVAMVLEEVRDAEDDRHIKKPHGPKNEARR